MSFLKFLLKLGFITLCLVLFFTNCGSHKLCNAEGAKKKYHSKRYRAALAERDSLCQVATHRMDQISAMQQQYNDLLTKYNSLEISSGKRVTELNQNLQNLNNDLQSNKLTLQQREERLRQLESVLRRQDSVIQAVHNSLRKALLGFKPDELSVEMRDGKVYISMSDKLLFKSGDANVEAKGREALKKLAEVLSKNNDVTINVEGHTDNVPIKTSQYNDNWDLSTARATNVVRILVTEGGMDPRKLTASGKGENFPIASNDTPEGRSKNRRTEIVLSPRLEELMNLISLK